MQRDIIERTTKDEDLLLMGYMQLLTVLLQKCPAAKRAAGEVLMRHLIHDCLFEIPHGAKY